MSALTKKSVLFLLTHSFCLRSCRKIENKWLSSRVESDPITISFFFALVKATLTRRQSLSKSPTFVVMKTQHETKKTAF